jgi:hypothetical protein
MAPDDARSRAASKTWPVEFLLYAAPAEGEPARLLGASRRVPEHRVNQAVAEALEWLRENVAACTEHSLLRVTVNGEIHLDAPTRFVR